MTVEQVRCILSHYTELLSLEGTYAAVFPFDNGGRLSSVTKKKLATIQSWLLMLYDEERFVVTKHLFDGLTWPMVEREYELRWGKRDGKAERTLRRYQRVSLQKIAIFINTNRLEPEVLSLFRNELSVAGNWPETGRILSLHEQR